MAIEDTFKGARNAYIYYFAFLTMVAREIGMERAIALQTKMCEETGTLDGKMIKSRLILRNSMPKQQPLWLKIMLSQLVCAWK